MSSLFLHYAVARRRQKNNLVWCDHGYRNCAALLLVRAQSWFFRELFIARDRHPKPRLNLRPNWGQTGDATARNALHGPVYYPCRRQWTTSLQLPQTRLNSCNVCGRWMTTELIQLTKHPKTDAAVVVITAIPAATTTISGTSGIRAGDKRPTP